MRLFIRIQNGQPDGHPILQDNFQAAFPDIDMDNLPSDFMPFVRVPYEPIPYKECVGSRYEIQDGVVRDVWDYRDMTAEEAAEYTRKIDGEYDIL